MLNRLNIALSVILALTLVLVLISHQDHSQPNIEVLPHMKYSPAYAAFAPNPHLRSGRTSQEPVFGTIARGDLPLDFLATKEDAVRAGERLQNPFLSESATGSSDPQKLNHGVAPLKDSAKRGVALYQVYCVACHGANGAGDGSVAKRGYPPPPSLVTGNTRQMKDGQLFHILTYGQANMPPFRAQLTRNDRWDLVNFIRGLQTAASVSSAPTSEPAAPNIKVPVGSNNIIAEPTGATE